jgi:hypothetical protein
MTWMLQTLMSCDPVEKAHDMCRDRRELLDGLYTTYGGAEGAKGGGLFGNAIGGADRANFEAKCRELGAGGHPTLLTDKARTFFGEAATAKTCAKVVDLETKVAAINRELPETDRVTCP